MKAKFQSFCLYAWWAMVIVAIAVAGTARQAWETRVARDLRERCWYDILWCGYLLYGAYRGACWWTQKYALEYRLTKLEQMLVALRGDKDCLILNNRRLWADAHMQLIHDSWLGVRARLVAHHTLWSPAITERTQHVSQGEGPADDGRRAPQDRAEARRDHNGLERGELLDPYGEALRLQHGRTPDEVGESIHG
jgi:hypothetical protein